VDGGRHEHVHAVDQSGLVRRSAGGRARLDRSSRIRPRLRQRSGRAGRLSGRDPRYDRSGACTHQRGEGEDELAVLVAGEVAEIELGVLDHATAAECARSDRKAALEIARHIDPLNPDRAIRRASAQVRDFLGGRNWWALERFGRILWRQRVLEGDELNSLLRAALSGARDLWAAVETENREIAIGRRLVFERLIRQGLDEGTAWAEADRQARMAEANREATVADPGERLRQLVAATRGPGR
jgi:hypothetical protein